MADIKNPHLTRLSWDETFMNLALLVAQRTACRYHTVGAVFVDVNKRIVSLGYNGPSEGDYHCNEVGCAKVDGNPQTKKLERCRGVHAEINGIINACGVRIFALPATPDKVKAGWEAKQRGQDLTPPKYFLGSDFEEELEWIKANPV